MLRSIFRLSIVASALATLAAVHPVQAGERSHCAGEACKILHQGHVRGRIPVACVSIPFVMQEYGKVAMFAMRDFNPNDTPEGKREQLANALFHDSKITGPVDDFCQKRSKFAGVFWVVYCDEKHGMGWATGEWLQYAIRHGHPPDDRRVHIGTHV